jgi:hypothetical protein
VNVLENKQTLVILIALVLVVAVAGFIIKMNLSATGQFTRTGGPEGGGMIQYSYPEEACESLNCGPNAHGVFIETSGGRYVWSGERQTATCYCSNDPFTIIFVPMVHPLQPTGRYIIK